MAIRHRAFLLDASKFKREVLSILTPLDEGDARPLYEQALTVVERVHPEHWPLRQAGSSLLDVRKVNIIGQPREKLTETDLSNASDIPGYELGYWLLLIFSTFLQTCPGMGADYSILDSVLQMLGWNPDETSLLFEGVSTVTLLKADATPVSPISHTDPYWHWMWPPNTHSAGWLSRKQIRELHLRLKQEESAVRKFDHRRFGDQWRGMIITVPDGQIDYLERLHTTYDRAMMMLETAMQAQTELYMALSYA